MSNYTLSTNIGDDAGMEPWQAYRIKAAELRALAKNESDPSLKREFENLSHGYLRLAEQAERNSQLNIVYEPPPTLTNQKRAMQPDQNKTSESRHPWESRRRVLNFIRSPIVFLFTRKNRSN